METSSRPKHEQRQGLFLPVINRDRCEGKATCVPACPYGVLSMGILPDKDRSDLTVKGRIKGFVHGWKQTFIVKDDSCTACGLCVQACPEKAITLRRVAA